MLGLESSCQPGVSTACCCLLLLPDPPGPGVLPQTADVQIQAELLPVDEEGHGEHPGLPEHAVRHYKGTTADTPPGGNQISGEKWQGNIV